MNRVLILAVVATLTLTVLPAAGALSRPASIPDDGNAGPVTSLSAIKSGAFGANQPVTTQTVTVASLSCPSCDEATVSADFTVKDATGTTVRVHVPNTWQSTWNVKKQNFVPGVGMQVVVQGWSGLVNGERLITMKRFGEIGHGGPTVRAYDVAAGKVASGSFVWLAPVKVLNRGHWDDGDYSWDLRDPAGGGLIHAELTPPYNGQLHLPNAGDTVAPYGQVRYDPDHSWWELHPVRCWSTSECVPTSAGYVRNGPPPGTPVASGSWTGAYEQGGDVPLWVPISAGGGSTPPPSPNQGAFGASFSAAGNEWWLQTTVGAAKPVASVDASINGGAWTALTSYGWGWAKSLHAPAGSAVQFRATATDGSTATSVTYAWPPGSAPAPTGTGGTGAGTGAFTASFSPAHGNEWWIQTGVTASKPLAGVDAAVNGGGWVPLTKYDYGWAKSIHAAAGSQVTFRAHATDGSLATSGAYAWPK